MGMILTSNLLRLNYALTLGLSSIQSPFEDLINEAEKERDIDSEIPF
jgi:hypothetical protein